MDDCPPFVYIFFKRYKIDLISCMESIEVHFIDSAENGD